MYNADPKKMEIQ